MPGAALMSDGRRACLLLGVALLARVVVYLGTALFGTDAGQFLAMADLIGEGRMQEALSVTYHPGFPILTAAAKPFFGGGTERAGFWVSMLLGSAAVLPLFFAARDAFGSGPAFLAGLLYALHPYLLDVQTDAMSEGAFMFFLCASAWLTAQAARAPSLELSALGGLSACAAYLTRPEGLVAVALGLGWQALALLRFRDRAGLRIGGLLLAALLAILLAFPFLTWVKSVKGRWAVSAKGSVERGMEQDERAGASSKGAAGRYLKLGGSFLRLAGMALPFYLIGLWGLRSRLNGDALVLLSFPAGYLAGLLYAFRHHPWVSYRYLLPPMALLLVLAALGLWMAAGWLERRRPGWAAQALIVLVCVLPGVKRFKPERVELGNLREVALWMRSQTTGAGPARLLSTVDQLGYLSGCRHNWMPDTAAEARAFLAEGPHAFLAYTERDIGRKPPYLEELRAGLGPARVFPGDGNRMAVYVHRLR